jgi:hypothetical protein
MYKIKKRSMMIADFLTLKKYLPVKKHRQNSKYINFG